ncbi:hypothetical protein PGTUg99_037601 [Puccinia graminis f. sp. tritici]|uniref:Uncharacterized protein n=1 Tax=Puccinia graminis f. sp. tritici TaxID=56615 RepID=A0A5B0SMU9_PUCGR|nr:hypothetical protein PGTUg99_037601 [Puccinia graminis f. sp. tritici]
MWLDNSCPRDEQENAKRKACDLNHDVNDIMNLDYEMNVSSNSRTSSSHPSSQITNSATRDGLSASGYLAAFSGKMVILGCSGYPRIPAL